MDWIKLGSLCAGFVVILAAFALAWRNNTTSWTHLAIFAIGGVLAGISGIQLQGTGWSVDIGQIRDAAAKTSTAAADQADGLKLLNDRVDQLQRLVSSVAAAKASAPETVPSVGGGAPTENGPAPTPASANWQKQIEQLRASSKSVDSFAARSKLLSNQATFTLTQRNPSAASKSAAPQP